MPVTTRRQPRNLSHSDPNSKGGPSEDTSPRTMQESDVDDGPMDGSFAVSSSDNEDEEHDESVWDQPESDASEEESDHESDHSEVDDDYEGSFYTIKGYAPCELRIQ
jgi:hypothetical protein